MRKEIKDLHAYTAVYRDNSLVMIDARRKPVSYEEVMMNKDQKPKSAQPPPPSSLTRLTPIPHKKPRSKTAKAAVNRDPFHLKNCLQDVEMERKLGQDNIKQATKPPPLANEAAKMSTRKRLKRSNTAIPKSNHNQYQSLLPGNCTSYYSIRKYYEQEKDKLLVKWSPQERRKRTVRWILDNINIPQFSVMRQTTTSAIFREFKHYRESPTKSRNTATKHVTLPSITAEPTRLHNAAEEETAGEDDFTDQEDYIDSEEKSEVDELEAISNSNTLTVEDQMKTVSLQPTNTNPTL